MILNALTIALRQLVRNKTRTALTSLGILIGVAAVIVMVAIGEGATRSVEDDLASLGQNLLFVVPGSPGARGPSASAARPFTEADVEAISSQIQSLEAVAPSSSRGVIAEAGERSWTTTVIGTDLAYLAALQWEIDRGREFTEGELMAGADVCLLGDTVAEELFGSGDPLDQVVLLGTVSCRVVGVTVPKGQNTFGQDQDDFIIMPLRGFQRRILGSRDISVLYLWAEEGTDLDLLTEEVTSLMRQRRHIREGSEDDFVVRDMREIASMLDSISGVLTGLLASVAAVSLLVGGIGIMNIMLVSVTERTREIGIRLAVGAQARDVLTQFLVESVVLSGVGGLLGIAVGILGAWAGAELLDIPLVVRPPVVLLSFGVSALIGVLFGFFPARRAARMRPIDALRQE